MDRIIAVDFDGVLFDIAAFKADYFEFLSQGIGIETVLETYELVKKEAGYYDADLHVSLLVSQDRQLVVQRIKSFLKNSRKYLFPETEEFLRSLQDYCVYIVSTGTFWFQAAKIQESGVENLVKKVYITQEKEKIQAFTDIVGSSNKVVVLEDSSDTIDVLKTLFPAMFIIHVRGREKSELADASVSDLDEALRIIR